MLKYNLHWIMDVRGIRQKRKFLLDLGIGRNIVTNLLNGKSNRVSLENILLISKALNCTPNDFIDYIPGPKEKLNDSNNAVLQLSKANKDLDVKNMVMSLPLHKLEELKKTLDKL